MPLSNAQSRDVSSLLHPYTNPVTLRDTGPLVLERGRGVRVIDERGKDYIEAMAGLWCTALGWGEEALIEAATEQMRKLAFGHLFAGRSHEPAIALAEKLKEIVPFRVGKVFFANSGSEANDTQIKLFWYANNARGKPAKKKIVSRLKSYHGVTIASASLTGLPANQQSFDLPLDFARFAECPHYYRHAEAGESEFDFSERMAKGLEALIEKEGPETIAAMILEPLQGAGGVILPPQGYFDAITRVLDRHGIPMIDDEVITGFGRTGNWFGCATYGFEPQTMTVAKALSSAYLPISAVLLSPELSETIEAEFWTHRGVRPRLHLFGTSGCRRRRAQDDRDFPGTRYCRPRAPCRTAFSRTAWQTCRSPVGRRSARRRTHWRHRDCRRQKDETEFRAGESRCRPDRQADRRGGRDLPAVVRGSDCALPATRHFRGRNRRVVRSFRARTCQSARLGQARGMVGISQRLMEGRFAVYSAVRFYCFLA